MRPATYLVAALFAVSTALGAATPAETGGNDVAENDAGANNPGPINEEPDIVTLTEEDLEPIPDDGMNKSSSPDYESLFIQGC